MNQERDRYLAGELFSLTLMGTVQRADVYVSHATQGNRRAFQATLRDILERLLHGYQSQVAEEEHINNIVTIADTLSTKHGATLANGRFRIGTAQKALNLYLKYMWCVGKIPEPPHCPFDSVVIKRVPGCRRITWTTLDSAEDYRKLVTAAKATANGVSLSAWELRIYNNAQQGVVADGSRLHFGPLGDEVEAKTMGKGGAVKRARG